MKLRAGLGDHVKPGVQCFIPGAAGQSPLSERWKVAALHSVVGETESLPVASH